MPLRIDAARQTARTARIVRSLTASAEPMDQSTVLGIPRKDGIRAIFGAHEDERVLEELERGHPDRRTRSPASAPRSNGVLEDSARIVEPSAPVAHAARHSLL